MKFQDLKQLSNNKQKKHCFVSTKEIQMQKERTKSKQQGKYWLCTCQYSCLENPMDRGAWCHIPAITVASFQRSEQPV